MEDDNRRQREKKERETGRKVGRGVVRGTSCSQVLWGEGGGRQSITLLEGFQASPARPSGKNA